MQRWDYHWVNADAAGELYERIAREGDSGWELVSVTAAVGAGSARWWLQTPGQPRPTHFQAWFKRPRPSE